jgi:hypothetical protein
MLSSWKFRFATALLFLLSFSTRLVHGQTLPPPSVNGQKSATTRTISAQNGNETSIAGMDATAAQALVERLVVLISDSRAHPDKRARACEYLSQFGAHGAAAVPAITGFIEHQLTTGKLRYYFQEKPSSVIVYPEGTSSRLGRAVYALGEVGPMAGEAIPLLRKVTVTAVREESKPGESKSDMPKVASPRALAAEAIGKIGRPEALDILIALTNNDPHADTRIGAVKGLARLVTSDDPRTSMTAQAQLRVVSATDAIEGIREQANRALEGQARMEITKVVAASHRKK